VGLRRRKMRGPSDSGEVRSEKRDLSLPSRRVGAEEGESDHFRKERS
jgi:hypothetical protein